jgi:serine/threonine protein kinase
MSKPVQALGDFELIRQLGCGGMGNVFEARKVSLNRKVARKVLKTDLGLTRQSGLGRSPSPMAQSGSPPGEESMTPLHSGSGYFDQLARRVTEVAEGLKHAHRQGVIHHATKPGLKAAPKFPSKYRTEDLSFP